MSIKNNLFKEMLKMSSAAAQLRQHEGLIAQAQLLDPTHQKLKNLDPTRPNPTHGSAQPMDNSGSTQTGHMTNRNY